MQGHVSSCSFIWLIALYVLCVDFVEWSRVLVENVYIQVVTGQRGFYCKFALVYNLNSGLLETLLRREDLARLPSRANGFFWLLQSKN